MGEEGGRGGGMEGNLQNSLANAPPPLGLIFVSLPEERGGGRGEGGGS